MNNYKDIELIQNFRSGMLNEQEEIFFNERLIADNDFKELYDDFFESENLLKIKELWAVKEELNKYDYSSGESEGDSKGKWVLGISILLLLGGAGGAYFISKTNSSSELTGKIVSISGVSSIDNEANIDRKLTNEEVKNQNLLKHKSIEFSIKESKVSELTSDSQQLSDFKSEIISLSESFSSSTDSVNPINLTTEDNSILVKKEAESSLSHKVTVSESKNKLEETLESNDIIKEELSSSPSVQNYLMYLPGQTWKAPMQGKAGKLEIRDQRGNIIFSGDILKDESDEWIGTDMNSKEVQPGVYYFLLKEEGKKDKLGNITVLK